MLIQQINAAREGFRFRMDCPAYLGVLSAVHRCPYGRTFSGAGNFRARAWLRGFMLADSLAGISKFSRKDQTNNGE